MKKPALTRREFIRVGLAGGAALLIPVGPVGCGGEGAAENQGSPGPASPPAETGRFLDSHEYETLRAVTGVIIPEDEDPGAVSARVADYIDFLLGAFQVDPPRIYAAGPLSGRHGGENGFSTYLPLSRVKEIAWRTYIEGSRGIPEREFNGPVTGLQEIYTKGLEDLDKLARGSAQADFKELAPAQQEEILKRADPAFLAIVFDHTVEGMYAAPEYGGNRDLAGWKYIEYEGDRQPIGYTRREVEEVDPPCAAGILSAEEVHEAGRILQTLFSKPLKGIGR
jgi:hypothetical protein